MPRWKPGQSGNPAGGKPGHLLVRKLLEPRREALVAKAVELALAGNAKLLIALLERLAPLPRAEADRVTLPALAEADTLTDKSQAVLAAVASGDLPPDTGRMLLDGLAALARTVEVDELRREIEVLKATDLL